MRNESALRRIAQWSGLIHGLLAIFLGIYHAANRNAHVRWPDGKWTDDVNATRWRLRMFTLDPDIFVDLWTPIVFGLIAVLMHFRHFHLHAISDNFMRYFIFHFLMTMVGTIGYSGGLGILISIVGFFTCLMSLLAYFMGDGRADMNLHEKVWKGIRDEDLPATTTSPPTAVAEVK